MKHENTETFITQLKAQISATEAALQRIESDQRDALADITANGTWVMRTVLDSKRKPIQKMGLNPSVSIMTATEKMRKVLTKKLTQLNAQIKAAQAPTNEWAELKRAHDELS
jgi:SH3-like domain-containing protein